MTLDPQQRFELFVAGMLVASEAGREDLLPMLKSAAARAAAELRQNREQTARAAQRGGIRRVATRAGRYQ
jgi:hypothetical protein